MASRPKDHDPVLAADDQTVVGCTGCAWRPIFDTRDLRPSLIQFETHTNGPSAHSHYQALIGSLEQLVTGWEAWCHEHCRACRNPDPPDTPVERSQSHDCGITRQEVIEQVRTAMRATWS